MKNKLGELYEKYKESVICVFGGGGAIGIGLAIIKVIYQNILPLVDLFDATILITGGVLVLKEHYHKAKSVKFGAFLMFLILFIILLLGALFKINMWG